MGMYVRIKGHKVLSVAPRPLKPIKGTEVRYVEWLNHTKAKYLYVDNSGEIQEYNHAEIDKKFLEQQRANKLKELDRFFTDYIESYYPDIKQRSDMLDAEYHKSALLMINSTYTADSLHKTASDYAQKILQGTTTIDEIVASKPDEEKIHWEQGLKSAVRTAWYVKNKYIYHDFKKQILEAKTTDDLGTIEWSEETFLPFPNI